MLALDENDEIVKCLATPVDARFINTYKNLRNEDYSDPVIFRSMAQRKTVALCETQGRDYYYIDTGYIGNLDKRKNWHRVVKNGMQHSKVNYDLSNDRFKFIATDKPYLPFAKWKKFGGPILIVTPSEKPCSFYGINRDEWVTNTVAQLKLYTDRPIIIRDKGLRRERIGGNSIYQQFEQDKIYAVVTYNSIAATEAIGFGIPAFTAAPGAADAFCLKDLSKIESPLYADVMQVRCWQHWLAYCQYTPREMLDGTVFKLIKEYDLG